jgi:hypothetical protein
LERKKRSINLASVVHSRKSSSPVTKAKTIAAAATSTGATYYVNGSAIGSVTYSGTPLLFDTAHTVAIGTNTRYNKEWFQGAIYDVRDFASRKARHFTLLLCPFVSVFQILCSNMPTNARIISAKRVLSKATPTLPSPTATPTAAVTQILADVVNPRMACSSLNLRMEPPP